MPFALQVLAVFNLKYTVGGGSPDGAGKSSAPAQQAADDDSDEEVPDADANSDDGDTQVRL